MDFRKFSVPYIFTGAIMHVTLTEPNLEKVNMRVVVFRSCSHIMSEEGCQIMTNNEKNKTN